MFITIPLFPIAVVVVEPLPKIPFVGRLAPEGPISHSEMMLLSLPLAVTASVLKNIFAPLVATDPENAPLTEHLVIVLPVAPPIKRIVDVPVVADAVVFSTISELPPVFKPSTVTLSAPLKSINGKPAVAAPEIVLPTPPEGCIEIEVYDAAPAPLAFKIAPPTGSEVFPTMATVIAPVWVPALIAAKALARSA